MKTLTLKEQESLAKNIAEKHHTTHYRNDGITPYYAHIESAIKIANSKNSVLNILIYLHDVIEEGFETKKSLIEQGIDALIADYLDSLLTRKKGTTYSEYIEKIKRCNIHAVIRTKIADICSNLSDSPTEYQKQKYFKALSKLSTL